MATRKSSAPPPQFTLTQRPDTLTYDEAQRLLITDPLYEEARDFYGGDAWRNGEGWIGPRLDQDDLDSEGVLDEIESSFVPHSAMEEVTDRKKDALLGRPGTWQVALRRPLGTHTVPNPDGGEPLEEADAPTEEEQSLIDEANLLLVNWYDEKEVLAVLDEAQLDLELGGRGLARLIVPESELVVDAAGNMTFPSGKTIEEALAAVWPVSVPADQGVVLRDAVTMRQVGVFVYEVVDVLTGNPTQVAEISFVNDEGQTVIRVTGVQKPKGARKEQVVDFGQGALDTGGQLNIFEMRNKKPLITEAVLANQKLLNMSLTMMGMNAVLGGFLERVILNGQKPGHWEDSDGTTVPATTPGATFVAAPYKTGPGTTAWLAPKQLGVDPTTKTPVFADVDIKWRDPVKVETFVETQGEAYRNILQGTHQLHVIISGDAVASGESRKQARDDYEKSLKKDKAKLDKLGAWLLWTALAMAATLAGKSGRFAGLRVVYDTKVDAGPIAAIDRTAIREEVASNLRSRENAMVELRITDDPEAEEARIVEEQQSDDPIQQLEARQAAVQMIQNRLNPNPGGGAGGGSEGEGTDVRRGSGRSKPTVAS